MGESLRPPVYRTLKEQLLHISAIKAIYSMELQQEHVNLTVCGQAVILLATVSFIHVADCEV